MQTTDLDLHKDLEKFVEINYELVKRTLRVFIFEIHSAPKPQQQTRQGLSFTGKKTFFDPSKMNKKMIQWQISPHAPSELLQGPVELHLTFYMPIAEKVPKAERKAKINNTHKHHKRPDLDNLAYVVTNAMKGIVYNDDSQICKMILEKKYGEEPKTVIMVKEV